MTSSELELATIPGNGHDECADAEEFTNAAALDAIDLPDELKGWFPSEYVCAILGHRRSGKTTLMAHHLLNAVRKGCQVYTNLDIYPEKLGVPLQRIHRPLKLDDLLSFDMEMSEAVIGIEEIGTWVESMRVQSNTNILLSKFFQLFIGKQKLRIFFTNQSEHLPYWIWQQVDLSIQAHDMFYTEWGRENGLAKGTSFYYIARDQSGIFTGQPGYVWTFGMRKANNLWDKFNSYQQFDPYLWARKTELVGEKKVVDMDTGQMYNSGEYSMEEQQRMLEDYDTFMKAQHDAWGKDMVNFARSHDAFVRQEADQHGRPIAVLSATKLHKAQAQFPPGSEKRKHIDWMLEQMGALITDSGGKLAKLAKGIMLFGKFGPWELLIIAFIILVVFGAGKLPNVMRDMGKSIKEFRNAHNEDTKETV